MKENYTLLQFVVNDFDFKNPELINIKKVESNLINDFKTITDMLDHISFEPRKELIDSILEKCKISE